jgi:transcriptional regulator with XRE-family HTH domain
MGTMLKELRETKGLTQVELAKKARVTQSYLAELEAGEKTNPSLEVIQRLAKALRVPLSELLP